MKRKFKLAGVHCIAIITYLGIILPLMALFVFILLMGGLAELYYNTYKFMKINVFKLDKPRTQCYNVINSDKK